MKIVEIELAQWVSAALHQDDNSGSSLTGKCDAPRFNPVVDIGNGPRNVLNLN